MPNTRRPAHGPNRRAVDATLRGLDGPAALIQLARSLADAVDRDPNNATLWREYRLAIADLTKHEGQGDGLADLIGRLSATVGDTEDGQADDGASPRTHRTGTGRPIHAMAADGGGRGRRVRRANRPASLP